jgi:hypothetical protein
MPRKTTAVIAAAALVLPMVSHGQADSSVPVPMEHQWEGHRGLYEPRLAFLAELNRWSNYWNTLFPADREPPSSGIKTLGAELAEFKRTTSSGMTVADLKKSKAAFAEWENRFSAELCALPGAAQSGQDCGAAAHRIRSAALMASPSVQKKERQRIAALAAAIAASNGDEMFDNGTARSPVATWSSAASASPARRGYVYSVPATEPAPVVVPPPSWTAPDTTEHRLVERLVRSIKRAAPWEWDGYCLTYVWKALTSTLKQNFREILGSAAQSAHTFIAEVRRVPELMARLNLHAINPFDGDGRAHLQKGMTIFYDRGVCGFDPDYGHAEIVTEVSSDGAAGRATSSNVENVRTACLSRALKSGLAMVVMPGHAAPAPTPY